MKFAIVALFLITFTTCSTFPDLEAYIDRDKIKYCIKQCEPVLDNVLDIIDAFEAKNYSKLFGIVEEIIDNVKQAVNNCKSKSVNDIVLEGGFWRKLGKALKKVVKVVVDVATAVVYVAEQFGQ